MPKEIGRFLIENFRKIEGSFTIKEENGVLNI